MTHSPVVLVHIYACKHVHSPLPQDIWAHEVFVIPEKPQRQANLPFRRRPPRKPNQRASPGRTYVDVCIWVPCLLMVLSAIQSPRRPT